MAKKRTKKQQSKKVEAADYRHTGQKRPNIPPAKIAGEGEVPRVPKMRYYYNPHLPPVLRFDSTGEADTVKELVYEAARRPLQPDEVKKVSEAIHHYDPWLEWAGKREHEEKGYFDVDPVALHIHERVSAQAIIRAAMRQDVQRDFFADPQQPYQEAIQFYRHSVDWANRLILGDSLQVMSSLARRENLGGKVQVIYIDPPYEVNFKSNFQPAVGKRDIKDTDADLTREPETVRAYRDTWTLGVHTYLTYLRQRLLTARELLRESGSVFVQTNDWHLHRVRSVLEEVFGQQQFCGIIAFAKTTGQSSTLLSETTDYLLWYCRDRSSMWFQQLYESRAPVENPNERYVCVEADTGELHDLSLKQKLGEEPVPSGRYLKLTDTTSQTGSEQSRQPFVFQGRAFQPTTTRGWSTSLEGLKRVAQAGYMVAVGKSLLWKNYRDIGGIRALTTDWRDLRPTGFGGRKLYVVETSTDVVARCILMTSRPGDLVLDPTCGSGTTGVAAERWGRRWILIDTSRVALAVARQKILATQFELYKTKDGSTNPAAGFVCKAVPYVGLRGIAQNINLDPIVGEHEPILNAALATCNKGLGQVNTDVRRRLAAKLNAKPARDRTDADRRRWDLPEKFEHWTVPFDTDSDWPKDLQDAVTVYRKAWRTKMDEVNRCIADNAEQEQLVDQLEVVKGVLRVSGPFTVEGVRPEELSLGEEGLFDATPNVFEDDSGTVEVRNITAYLTRMLQHLRADGLTFMNNQRKKFARIEPLFETQTGSMIHADGVWEGNGADGPNTVAIGFGPQYGPVTALQVEELIRAAKRYDELVVAGFSFDAEATEVIQAQSHPKLQIHQAYIRPDINPAMEGLLKVTPNSQLFTVFGQPEVEVEQNRDGEWVATLVGVDIYDPIENTVRSSGAEKVAAWFLDSDYDGRCFCITQAFFPDQDAWRKIAKALGSSADEEAFEKFAGTESLPFKAGKYKRIAVKVIDPRGNEVMAVRQLEG